MKFPRALRLLVLSLAFAFLTLPARAGDVVVVAPLGGDGVALLQAAIDAASDGDILLLRDGNYVAPDSTPFVIDGKGVSVITDEGHGPLFMRGFLVKNTPAGSLVLLRGLQMIAWEQGTVPADLPLRATNVAGTLWLEACVLEGQASFIDVGATQVHFARPAAILQDCASVVMERCQLNGGSGSKQFYLQGGNGAGAYGMELRNTSLVMHGSIVAGGDAGLTGPLGTDGGDGLRITLGSHAVLSASTCAGGDPGNGSQGQGGDAVQVLADGSEFWHRNNTFVTFGSGGQLIKGPASAVKTFSSPTGLVAMPPVVRVGAPGTFFVLGVAPDTAVFLGLSLRGGFAPLFGLEDALILDVGMLVGPKFMGFTDALGELSLPFQAPFLPPSIDGLTVLAQTFYVSPGGYPVLGPGSAMAVVQTSF